MNRDEAPPHDPPVSDRRRFNPDGSVRDAAAAESGAPPETAPGAAAPAEDAAPAIDWERRAREAEARLGELADSYRRGREELAAARARLERDQEQRVREGVGRAFTRLLDALDALDLALAHAPEGPLAEGVLHARRLALEALAGEGLERVSVVGQPFDPAFAEAVLTTPAADAGVAPQTVVEEFRAGWRMGERMLRPAQVRVAV